MSVFKSTFNYFSNGRANHCKLLVNAIHRKRMQSISNALTAYCNFHYIDHVRAFKMRSCLLKNYEILNTKQDKNIKLKVVSHMWNLVG